MSLEEKLSKIIDSIEEKIISTKKNLASSKKTINEKKTYDDINDFLLDLKLKLQELNEIEEDNESNSECDNKSTSDEDAEVEGDDFNELSEEEIESDLE